MIVVRPATNKDSQVLSNLGKTTFIETFAKDNRPEDIEQYVLQTFSSEKQLDEINDPNRTIEIAWVEGVPAGYLHLLVGNSDPSITGEKPIEILRLYVDARWHGKGVGAILMERAIQIAQECGYQTLWLGVWEQNFRAQAFYAKYGFVVVGSHVFQLGKDDQTDLIMEKNLAN